MVKKQTTKHHMDGLLVLLMFGVLAACVLSVLLTGAGAYRRLTERDDAAYDRRTAAQYVATRVRQADVLGGVFAEQFGDTDALVLTEEIDGALYETRIYYHDGYIRELFTEVGYEFLPEDGEKVLKAGGMTISEQDGCLHCAIQAADGSWDKMTLSLRSGRGAAS